MLALSVSLLPLYLHLSLILNFLHVHVTHRQSSKATEGRMELNYNCFMK